YNENRRRARGEALAAAAGSGSPVWSPCADAASNPPDGRPDHEKKSVLIQPVRQPPDRLTAVPQPRHRSGSRTEILVYNPWPDRSRKLLIAVSSAIAILALFLALKSYGATELLAQYRTFLLMLTAAGLGVWVMPKKLLQDRRFQVFLLIGAFLLFQSWWLNTLEARGYILL